MKKIYYLENGCIAENGTGSTSGPEFTNYKEAKKAFNLAKKDPKTWQGWTSKGEVVLFISRNYVEKDGDEIDGTYEVLDYISKDCKHWHGAQKGWCCE